MIQCPVQTLQMQAATLGGEMLRALHRLRLEAAACQNCPQTHDCPTRDELNVQIDVAICETAAEWELTRWGGA